MVHLEKLQWKGLLFFWHLKYNLSERHKEGERNFPSTSSFPWMAIIDTSGLDQSQELGSPFRPSTCMAQAQVSLWAIICCPPRPISNDMYWKQREQPGLELKPQYGILALQALT